MLECKVDRVRASGEAKLGEHGGCFGVLCEQVHVGECLEDIRGRMRGAGLKNRRQRGAGRRVRLGRKRGMHPGETGFLNDHRGGLAAVCHAPPDDLQPVHARGGGLRSRQIVDRGCRAADRHAVTVPLVGRRRAGPQRAAGHQLQGCTRAQAAGLGLGGPLGESHGAGGHVVDEQLVDA